MSLEPKESLVRVWWEPHEGGRRCRAELLCSATSAHTVYGELPNQAEHDKAEERMVREIVLRLVFGDLEEENRRLRRAVKKWGAMAISRAEWRAPEKEEAELEEDLR